MKINNAIYLLALMVGLTNPSYAAISDFKVHVEGMHCGFCATSINKQLHDISSVESSDIVVADGVVEIKLKEGKRLDYRAIKKAVKKAGFKVTGAELKVTGKITRNHNDYIVLESDGDKSQFTPHDEASLKDHIVDDYLQPTLLVKDPVASKIYKARKSGQTVSMSGEIHEHLSATPLGILIDEINFH